MFRLLIALVLMLVLPLGQAQTPVSLFESFAGNVNFTGTQKTIRTRSNASDPCSVTRENTDVEAVLSGIPTGATILRAHLYWAGSGGTPDYDVEMDRNKISAATDRSYTASANGRWYFGGGADVTSRVASKRNGTYRFRGLSVSTQRAYCDVEGVVGGFALLVVYSHSSEPFRVLNVYEGFRPTYYSSVDLSLSNFQIPDPIGTATGRIGHITWEGDSTLGNTNEEDLFFNGYAMTDSRNPRYNQFNSSSNINNDSASYGIDFDAYTVSSPIIQSGQTAATTRYQSGQDLVLLHNEVIAVPNVPVSDISIGMTVASPEMTQGVTNLYQITVKNNGPMADPGPIVVTDTLHSSLAITSASGTGWVCSISGQTVTCTSTGPTEAGATLSPITIVVTPSAMPPNIDNTASVAGQNFDNFLENNSATVSTTASSPDYVLTDLPCWHGLPFTHFWQFCRVIEFGDRVAGATISPIYITALDANGVPTRLHQKQDRTVNFYFGMSCINPTTTANEQFDFTARPSTATCAAASANKPVGERNMPVVFPGGWPSSGPYSLTYDDVGMVELYFQDSTGKTGSSGPFVFVPAKIALTSITRNSDDAPNPGASAPDGLPFIPAGDPFSMTVASLSSTGSVTPNFGREKVPEKFAIEVGGAIDSTTGEVYAEMVNGPTMLGTFGQISAGSASGTNFSWDEVGILRLVPGTESGTYLGRPVSGEEVRIGRFYPHHFDTEVEPPLPSLCPVSAPCTYGSAYSKQPFTVEVTARNAGNNVTQNYQGRFARDVQLTAWGAMGGTTTPNPPATPSGAALSDALVVAANFNAGIGVSAKPTYTLPNSFSSLSTAPRPPTWVPPWVAPTTIYLRATETSTEGVTSLRGAASEEGPVWIVAGRLMVSNTYGSELLNLPVPVKAQYWTGTRWINSLTDNVSIVEPLNAVTAASNLEVFGCVGQLAANCTLVPLNTALFTLTSGAGVLRLQAPGQNRSGGAKLRVNSPAWLPSTVGQLVFGKRRATLDYIREVY